MEGFHVLPQSARHIYSARNNYGAMLRGLRVRTMMARGRIFSHTCQRKHMKRLLFFASALLLWRA